MDHHDHMNHGGMDMPSSGPQCSMNASLPYSHLSTQSLCLLTHARIDALHMGHHQPLHNLSPMARPLHLLSSHVPRRRHRPHRRLRIHQGDEQAV